jgi:hypothetical protein
MKYISFSLEKSGSDPNLCDVLSFCAMIEDPNAQKTLKTTPTFIANIDMQFVKNASYVFLDNFSETISTIAKLKKLKDKKEIDKYKKDNDIISESDVVKEFHKWLYANYAEKKDYENNQGVPVFIYVAGYGIHRDIEFLKKLPFWKELIKIEEPYIDPAVMCLDMKKDTNFPSLKACRERTSLKDEKPQDILIRSWETILMLREQY